MRTKKARRAVALAIIALLGFGGYAGFRIMRNTERADTLQTKVQRQVQENHTICTGLNETKDLIRDVLLELAKALGPGEVVSPSERLIYDTQFAPKLVHEAC